MIKAVALDIVRSDPPIEIVIGNDTIFPEESNAK